MSTPSATGTSSVAKPIKDQNRWQLWLVIVANVVAFYVLMQWDEINAGGISVLFTKAANILPLGLAVVVVTVLNGLLSPNAKARIVFLRWNRPLPGHGAFTDLAPKDPRIDMGRLKKACGNKMPVDPDEQNSTWYRLYKSIEKHPTVEHVQRDFLLTRDYASFLALTLVFFSTAAVIELSSITPGAGSLFPVQEWILIEKKARRFHADGQFERRRPSPRQRPQSPRSAL